MTTKTLSRRSKPGRDGTAIKSKNPQLFCRIESCKNRSNRRRLLQIHHHLPRSLKWLVRNQVLNPLRNNKLSQHLVQLHHCQVLVKTCKSPKIGPQFTSRSRREKEQMVKEPNNTWVVRLNRPLKGHLLLVMLASFQPTILFQQDQIIASSKTRKSSKKSTNTSKYASTSKKVIRSSGKAFAAVPDVQSAVSYVAVCAPMLVVGKRSSTICMLMGPQR